MNITDERITALRAEAVKAGDMEMVAVCDMALKGSTLALAECARVIADAVAMIEEARDPR